MVIWAIMFVIIISFQTTNVNHKRIKKGQRKMFQLNKAITAKYNHFIIMSSLDYNIWRSFCSFFYGQMYSDHIIARPIESELSFSTGTFLNNYDVINRKLQPLQYTRLQGKKQKECQILQSRLLYQSVNGLHSHATFECTFYVKLLCISTSNWLLR